jgi:hypothetical protein
VSLKPGALHHASWTEQWWASLKQAGIYPLPCLACGSWVPQWDEDLLG